jgi:tetratricopeptide (TPR) repeat protein
VNIAGAFLLISTIINFKPSLDKSPDGFFMSRTLRILLMTVLITGLVSPVSANPVIVPAGINTAGQPKITGILSEAADNILYAILDLRFSDADSMLTVSLGKYPGNPGLLYLRNYLEFLDALIAGTRESFDAYTEQSARCLESIRAAGKKDTVATIFLSSVHLQSSLLSAYHGENFNAARHFIYAHRFLRQSEERGGGDALKFRNRGLITVSVGSVPEEYRWLLKVFGMRGEIEEGLGYLEEYLAFTEGARRVEAGILLKLVSPMAGSAGKDPDHTGKSGTTGPDSLTLLIYARALQDLTSGKSRKVIEDLSGFVQASGERELPYLDLLLGEAMLNGLDSNACIPLERFAENHAAVHYRHYAWHKLSWCYALQGRCDRYEETRRKVLDCGEAFVDADRQALSEASDTLPLNTSLLKARLLFDGGYYHEALALLEHNSSIPLMNSRDTIEYRYRLARTHERLGNPADALSLYQQVLSSKSAEDWYFAPNAALHAGLIFEAEGSRGKAFEYYRLCLKINNSSYKRSIDYKARQGINRLEKLQRLK